jgi:hypothetical protein
MRARWLVPQIGTDAIKVIHNLSIFDGEFADKSLGAVEARVQHIRESEFTVLEPQYGNVGDRTRREVP